MSATEPSRPRHVVLYGPPAAGKLTVAQVLSVDYGFRLLDNHVAIDAALRLFAFGTTELSNLVEKLRSDLFTAAASAGIDVVSTLVFAHPVDRPRVTRLTKATETAGATVTFVQLRPSLQVLERRVTEASRSGTRKISDLALLHRMLDQHDLLTPINDNDLSIDNSELVATDVAQVIAREVRLDSHSGSSFWPIEGGVTPSERQRGSAGRW